MRVTTWLLASTLVLSVAGCSASKSTTPSKSSASGKTMPNVTGKKLDVAEDAIESAGGDPDEVKEIGGGKFGIVVKSNWTVCSQVPAAGEALPASPQLTVERNCATTSASASAPTSSPSAPAPSASTSGTPTAAAPLTISSSRDLAALLKVGDGCDPPVATFAKKYGGRSIEFDATISALAPNGSDTYDVLVAPGNKGAVGPNFQFQDVSDLDLGPAGSDSLEVGVKVHIVAGVGDYNAENCLLQLTPISTQVR